MDGLKSIELNMSTSDHSQTDGPSEYVTMILGGILTNILQTSPADWNKYLSDKEFEYNCRKHESTGLTTFEADFGRNPAKPTTRELKNCRKNV